MSSVVDYQVFCPQGTPKEEREKFRVGDIYSNAARCLKCGDVIRSRNRHDYVQCSCKALAVDGGSCYARRIGNPEDYEDLTEMYDDC
jgi:hypothetical protein